jgi:hypothetical protein
VLSRAVGKPVRVQWSRADENGWEAFKAARISECVGGLDANGKIVVWHARTFGLSGYSRPEYHEPKHGGEPGSLVTAQLAGWDKPGLEEGFSGAAGNFEPVYEDMPNKRVVFTYLGPRRTARAVAPSRRLDARRGLARQYLSSRMLHGRARPRPGMDAIEFRLKHSRGRAALRCSRPLPSARNGRRACRIRRRHRATSRVAAVSRCSRQYRHQCRGDFRSCGESEDGRGARRAGDHCSGLRAHRQSGCGAHQIEGGIIQSISRALKEEVTFDKSRVTSLDWASYPIITFKRDSRRDRLRAAGPSRSAGDARGASPRANRYWPGCANAVYDAIGVRLRQLPLTPQRVLRWARRQRLGARYFGQPGIGVS